LATLRGGWETFDLDNKSTWGVNFEDEGDAKNYAPSGSKIVHEKPNDYFRVEATQQQWIDKQGRSWFCTEIGNGDKNGIYSLSRM